MLALLLYIAVGLTLLALLFLSLLRRTPGAEGSAQALLDARQAVRTLQTGLLPSELVHRLFSKQDLNYVGSCGSKSIQQLFQAERKRIALSWVSQIHRQIVCLQDFHRGHSRHFAQLNPRQEIVLALEFAALRMECRVLSLLLALRGPYGATRIAGRTAASASRLCDVSENALSFLTPAGTVKVVHDSAQGGAAT
jgi:hypothetical protein